MRRGLIAVLVLSMAVPASRAVAAAPHDGAGSITGSARAISARNAANATVRLRNLTTGEVVGTTVTDATGTFSFAGIEQGNYVVELLDGAGGVVATSAPVALTGADVTGVALGGTQAATAAAGSSSFFGSTIGIITLAAAGAAVAGVTVAANRTTASSAQ